MDIYQAISNVMADVGSVTKAKKNTSGNPFMYRGIDDVMNALNPAMIKNKLFVVPEVLEQIREDRTSNKGSALIYSVCKIKYTFYAEDGTNVSAVVVGEAFDSGDKATNKAMSIAFKYACFQVFCIPTEEMKDPDSESHEINTNAPKPKENKSTELDNKTDGFSKHDELVGIFHQEIARTGKSLKWFLTSSKVSDAKYIKTTELNGYIDGLKKLPSKEVTN